jgi:hypothetical protein
LRFLNDGAKVAVLDLDLSRAEDRLAEMDSQLTEKARLGF